MVFKSSPFPLLLLSLPLPSLSLLSSTVNAPRALSAAPSVCPTAPLAVRQKERAEGEKEGRQQRRADLHGSHGLSAYSACHGLSLPPSPITPRAALCAGRRARRAPLPCCPPPPAGRRRRDWLRALRKGEKEKEKMLPLLQHRHLSH